MKTIWKRSAWIGGGAVLAAAMLWWQRGPITVGVMTQQINSMTAISNPLALLADGLHVGLCGAGSPFPDTKRSGPCTVVVAGRRMFVFDSGSGASRNIARMRLNSGQIEALFLTHYHSDHIDGLGELMLQRWIQGEASIPVPIYGPPGLETVINGFNNAYTLDKGYRIAHHGESVAPPDGFGGRPMVFDLPVEGSRKVLISEPDLEIAAFAVQHSPASPAVGYKIRYKDRSIVISGDTKKVASVAREAVGADLLVHEALSPVLLALLQQGFDRAKRANLSHIMHDVVGYHTTPEEAAEIAQSAGVKALVLNHIVPPLPLQGLDPVFLQKAKKIYDGPLRIGEDGDWFSLPAGSTAVEMGKRL